MSQTRPHPTELTGREGNGKSESQISARHEYSDYNITTLGNCLGPIIFKTNLLHFIPENLAIQAIDFVYKGY